MKGRVAISAILLCILLVPSQDGFVILQSIESDTKIESRIVSDYTVHDPIIVDYPYSESNFTQSGTAEDPFIIENLRIETNQSCITVRNLDTTTVYGNGTSITSFRHLVIRNCLFVGIPYVWFTGDIQRYGFGVFLDVDAHNVTIINNRFEDLMRGVWCFYESNNNIIKSNYFNCSQGVKVGSGSSANIICDNMFVGGSDPFIKGAISISNSLGNFVINNTCRNLGSGIDLVYMATNTTIFNNTITNSSSNGINLVQSNFVVVTNNTCDYNYYSGIWVDEDSTNCTIANNTLAFNGRGFEEPATSTLAHESASEEGGGGIRITNGSSGNSILFNDLIYNQRNALDEVPGNLYDFNFWTDYTGTDSNDDDIGDTPYYVAGAGGGVDEHPRMNPWSSLPTLPTPTTSDGDTDSLTTYLIVGFGLAIAAIVVVIIIKKRPT